MPVLVEQHLNLYRFSSSCHQRLRPSHSFTIHLFLGALSGFLHRLQIRTFYLQLLLSLLALCFSHPMSTIISSSLECLLQWHVEEESLLGKNPYFG